MLKRNVNEGKGSGELHDAIFVRMAAQDMLVRESGGTAYRATPSSYIDTDTLKPGDKLLVRLNNGYAEVVAAYAGTMKSGSIDSVAQDIIVADTASGSINNIPVSHGIKIVGDDGIIVDTNEYENKIIVRTNDNMDFTGKDIMGVQSVGFENCGTLESTPDDIQLLCKPLVSGNSTALSSWEMSNSGTWKLMNRPEASHGIDFTPDYLHWHGETGALMFKLDDAGVTVGLPGSDNKLTVTANDGLVINGESIIAESLDAESIGPKLTAYISEIAGDNPMYFDATYKSYDGTSPWGDLLPPEVTIGLVLSKGIELWVKSGAYGHTQDETIFEVNNSGVRLGSGDSAVTVDQDGTVVIPEDLFVGGSLDIGEAIKVLEPGTNWNSLSDPDTASGIVITVDASDGAALVGYDEGVKQAYFDSRGKIGWAQGFGEIDSIGQTFHDTAHGQFVTPVSGIGAYQNVLHETESFSNDDWWTYTHVTVVASSMTSPNGSIKAKKVLASSVTVDDGVLSQRFAMTSDAVVDDTYTFSIWLKSGSGTVDVEIGDVGNGSTDNSTKTVTTKWRRYSHTLQLRLNATEHEKYTNAGIIVPNGEYVYAWGAQLFNGSVPGVYAPGPILKSHGLTSNSRFSAICSGEPKDAIRVVNGSVYFQNDPDSNCMDRDNGYVMDDGDGDIEWVSFSNANNCNDQFASATHNTVGQVTTNKLKVPSNVPDVPVGAKITGLQVITTGKFSFTDQDASDIISYVMLSVNGNDSSWRNFAGYSESNSTTYTGGQGDMWGLIIDDTDIITNTSVILQFNMMNEGSTTSKVYVDCVRLKVYYDDGHSIILDDNAIKIGHGLYTDDPSLTIGEDLISMEKEAVAQDGLTVHHGLTCDSGVNISSITSSGSGGTGINLQNDCGYNTMRIQGRIHPFSDIPEFLVNVYPHDTCGEANDSIIQLSTWKDFGNYKGGELTISTVDGVKLSSLSSPWNYRDTTMTFETNSFEIVIHEDINVDGAVITSVGNAISDSDALNLITANNNFLRQDGTSPGATTQAQDFGTNGITTDAISVSTSGETIKVNSAVEGGQVWLSDNQFKVYLSSSSYQYFSIIPNDQLFAYMTSDQARQTFTVINYKNDPTENVYALSASTTYGVGAHIYSYYNSGALIEAKNTTAGSYALKVVSGEFSIVIDGAPVDGGGELITNIGNATADTDALNRITADGRYLQDAPSDGEQYARKDGAWVIINSVQAPDAPTSLSLSEETGNVVKLTFNAPAAGELPDHYEVWMSHDDTKYYLIANVIQSGAAGSAQTVYDETYTRKTTNYYKVYAVANGEVSTALAGNITTTQNASDPSNVKAVQVGDGFFLSWEDPSNTRLFDGVEIKMHHADTTSGLSESSAATVYSGRANSYRAFVAEADMDDYFQFWLYPLTRT